MTSLKQARWKWMLDPNDGATLALVQRLTEELLPFEGHLVRDLESAIMEMNLQEGKESIRKLRSELMEAVTEGRSTTIQGNLDPPEIRLELFRLLWERGLGFVTATGDLFSSADDLIAATGRHFGVSPQVVMDNLYADTPGERRASFPVGDPATLASEAIRAINLLRLKQRLRKALGMTLVLPLATKGKSAYVSMFWLLKRGGLMYDGVGSGTTANLSITGPYALFERTTAYGNRLYEFCRSLFSLRAADWTATVDLMIQSADGMRQLGTVTLDASMNRFFGGAPEQPVVSTTRSGDEDAFRRYFEKLSTGWSLDYEGALVPIDDPGTTPQRFMIPDFVARYKTAGREVLIELVGYWRSEYLHRKLGKVTRLKNRTIILLVNRKLLVGPQEAAALEEAGVRVLYYEGREKLKEAAREVGRMLKEDSNGLTTLER